MFYIYIEMYFFNDKNINNKYKLKSFKYKTKFTFFMKSCICSQVIAVIWQFMMFSFDSV